MSKIKKKNTKPQSLRLNVLAASLMTCMTMTHAATDTVFSTRPLVGVSESFAPHIVLALSVEFPTAGAAYSENTLFSVKAGSHKQKYRGYFDSAKCYKYNHTEGYFEPSSVAETDKDTGEIGLCNNGSETEEFSGNFMNFMTMSAIDIFRGSMTGGNRAKGLGTDGATYAAGDTTAATYLRRANVSELQNGGWQYKMADRAVEMHGISEAEKKVLHQMFPKAYTDYMMADSVRGDNLGGDTPNQQIVYANLSNQYGQYGRPRNLGFKAVTPAIWSGVTQQTGAAAGASDRFADGYLRLWNDGFKVQFVRRVNPVLRTSENYIDSGLISPNRATSANRMFARSRGGGNNQDYYVTYKPDNAVSGWDTDKWAKPLNVVVKVCDPNEEGGVESNCVLYDNNGVKTYKPEGLMQQYTKEKDMRFATMGYLNQHGNNIDGGVLRSSMKKLINDADKGSNYADEWDQKTGIFNINPDANHASQSGVSNSGAINYLNKFGDKNGYKGNDPAGELYYTALAYLMGDYKGSAAYKESINTVLTSNPNAKDGFPVITEWDDPYKRGIDSNQAQCHQSSIILIGDTYTHEDGNIPTSKQLDKETVNKYLTRLLKDGEKSPYNSTDNFGSSNSPPVMAGLAYWARTNDIRPDIPGVQNGNNFIVDVLELGAYKVNDGHVKNTYYLAAKYGGFTRTDNSKDGESTEADKKELPETLSSWSDDATQTSISAFTKGVPRNYAIANNPDNMVSALEKAMSAGGALNNPSQAATGLSVNQGEILDFTGGKKPITLQSTYNFAALSGDVVAYETSYKELKDGEKVGDVLFDTTKIWSANEKLSDAYHNTSAYAARKVFTTVQNKNQAIDFNVANAASIFNGMTLPNSWTAADLTKYILGDNSNEGTSMRKRDGGLMGTVINSTVQAITAVKGNLQECKYADLNTAKNRGVFYAAASNNGMLHIFDKDGVERMAYMAGTALAKLPAFADRSYVHQYLNDGTPNVSEVCIGGKTGEARSVLLGTTGRGGSAVYALDVTNLSNPSASNVLWEFNNKHDSDLGYTISSPIITKSPDGNPIAIVSSGYNNSSNTGHIFILDISKPSSDAWQEGKNYWKIRLGNAGVGTPFVYDGDQDGVADKIFVGDVAGNLWQINRMSETGVQWAIPSEYLSQPLFKPTTDARPFTGAPYAEMVNGKLMVVAATGQYFSEKDLNTTQQNYAYGFIVDETRNGGVVQADSLLQQTVVEDVTKQTGLAGTNIKVYTITEKEMQPEHNGWRLTLLPGQNVAANAVVRKRQVAEFTAVRMLDNISLTCQRAGSTSYISVDVKNGGLNKKPIFDTNRDGLHNNDDKSVAIYEIGGMTTSQSTLMQVRLPNGTTRAVIRGTDGGITADVDLHKLDSEAGVRRISWREIF